MHHDANNCFKHFSDNLKENHMIYEEEEFV